MEPLSDPYGDRVVKSIIPPPHKPLTINLIWTDPKRNKPDWRTLQDFLFKEGRIEKKALIKLITDCHTILKYEGNVIYVAEPVTVVGDIHGQYYDLGKILEVGGNPEKMKYVFLGDYVDRGSFSIEVLILLYALKISYPETFHLLRGNHECRQMTTFFNFRKECLHKYDQEIYELFMDSFDSLPLSCIINSKFLALHGGLSPELYSIENLKKINRFTEPPKNGIFCDTLWADPVEHDEGFSKESFNNNGVRGCSYYFGNTAVTNFLENNKLLSIVRGHEVQPEGFKMHKWPQRTNFPPVITVFSAPNYCDVYRNKGAVIRFENQILNIKQYEYTAHPFLLPKFEDAFTWSTPYMAEIVTKMLSELIKPGDDDDEDEDDDNNNININGMKEDNDDEKNKKAKTEAFKHKLKFISKAVKINKNIRKNKDTILMLKGLCPDNKIPMGLLSQGSEALKNALEAFKNAKMSDLVNERRPENIEDFDKLKKEQTQV